MEDHDYSAARLEVLTLREAVARHPAMYFGDHPTADWPLVVAAWTAFDLLDYGVGSQRSVELILHRDGALSAAVAKGRVARSVTARPAPVDELVRRRMWWHRLGRSTEVTVLRDGGPVGAAEVVGDELVWDDLDIGVRLVLDVDLIGTSPGQWWHAGPARLRALLTTDRFRPAPGQRLTIIDEAAGTTTRIG
jgi:hypothetical protein